MRHTIRDVAVAFTAGAAIALAFDALLQVLAQAIHVTSGMTWEPLLNREIENSTWIALGLVVWLAAPFIGHLIEEFVPHVQLARRTVWELVALGFLTLPPGHVLGTWIVLAIQLTATAGWASEGGIFLSGAYYGSVLLSITPWMAAGAILRAWAHHMVVD